jgi:nucleoid-associated protein YgaU
LPRRFVPRAASSTSVAVATHVVKQGDRLDLIAARYYGDPLLYWVVCDANGAIRPDELVEEEEGASLKITTVSAVPGGTGA